MLASFVDWPYEQPVRRLLKERFRPIAIGYLLRPAYPDRGAK